MQESGGINIGPVEQIPEGMGKVFIMKDREIAVFRSRSGKIFAVDNCCPHRKQSLADGMLGDGVVVCPGHGHKFNLLNGEGREPGERIRVYPSVIVNGEIIIQALAES